MMSRDCPVSPRKLYEQFRNWYRRRALILEQRGLGTFYKNKNGYVLIIVMLVVTMLIAVSAEFLLNAQVNINYMKKFKDETQAASLAEAGLNLSHFILEADTKGIGGALLQGVSTDKAVDSYTDIWAIDLPDLTLESGSIRIFIDDEQSKINLNAIRNSYDVETKYYGVLERFFFNMGFTEDYAQAIFDWTDTNDTRFGNGAETTDYYATRDAPYSAKNAPFDSIDELLLVRYFTPEIYYGFGGGNSEEEKKGDTLVDTNTVRQAASMEMLMQAANQSEEGGNPALQDEDDEDDETKKYGPERDRSLARYFRTSGNNLNFLDAANKININTASYRVLLALSDLMTPATVEELIYRRNSAPFTSKNDEFLTAVFDEETREKLITFSSNVFLLKCSATSGSHTVVITCIVNRNSGDYYYYSIQ